VLDRAIGLVLDSIHRLRMWKIKDHNVSETGCIFNVSVVLYLWLLYFYDLFHILQSFLTYFRSMECNVCIRYDRLQHRYVLHNVLRDVLI
jgi:hypothetical protein